MPCEYCQGNGIHCCEQTRVKRSLVEHRIMTPADWEQEKKINVIDPDGWRFAHGGMQPKSYREAITEEEFMARVVWSTVVGL